MRITYEEFPQSGLNTFDSCFGTVEGSCAKGLFLRVDNGTPDGEEAFAYYSRLLEGSQVLCTVLRQPMQDGRKMLVSIDSVQKYA